MTSEAALPAIDAQVQKVNMEDEQLTEKPIEMFSQDKGDNFFQEPIVDSQVDVYKVDSKNLAGISEDMIPDELLFSLTHSQQLLRQQKKSQLAPLKEATASEKIKSLRKGPPSNVWHHKERRSHFKHLIDFPRSLGKGVGTRDVSFLYDVAHSYEPSPPSVSKLDKSAARLEAVEQQKQSKMLLPDTVIPEEYHMVKTKSVLGLEYVDKKNTTLAVDPEKSLRVFPSLKPNKRFEVIQLLQTLDVMLEESGIYDDSIEVKGPTQIHNLLELIKKEQNIYDLVFSEIIRQVSVECVERGQLLSKLRQNYADLLSRIPRQIQSLHAEVMAQRSLDRRLTEELVRFKSSIAFLTKELQSVREHDQHVTMEAQTAEEELAKALKESQTNANLVDEYHSLYELQRKRLEATVADLTTERDLWSNASYNLALKIAAANSLNTAKRLHVSEKAWSKLANHFTVVLSDQDSECLSEMQMHVEKWRSIMFQFKQDLERADKQTIEILTNIKSGLKKWKQKFDDTLMEKTRDAHYIKEPPADFVDGLCEFFKESENHLGENGERFAGNILLGNEEKISMMTYESEAWTEISWIVYRRHRTESDEPFPLCEILKEVNAKFHALSKQLQVCFSGENGVAKVMMNLQNVFDGWSSKLTLQLLGSDPVTDSEWLGLYEKIEDYENTVDDAINLIGSHQSDDDRIANLPHQHISINEVMTSVHEWMKATVNQIEAEDGKMLARVSSIHISLVRWMVQLLLNLVPNYQKSSQSSMIEPSMASTWTVEELVQNAKDISQHLSSFTDYAWQCCVDIVQTSMQKKKDHGDEDADHEYRDFLRLKMETTEWIRSCDFLLNDILPGTTSLFTNQITSQLQLPKDEIEKQKNLPAMPSNAKREPNKRSTRDFGRVKTSAKLSESGAESDASIKSGRIEAKSDSSVSRPPTQETVPEAGRQSSKLEGNAPGTPGGTDSDPKSISSEAVYQESEKNLASDKEADKVEVKTSESPLKTSKSSGIGKGGKPAKKSKAAKNVKSKKGSKTPKDEEEKQTDSTDEAEAVTAETITAEEETENQETMKEEVEDEKTETKEPMVEEKEEDTEQEPVQEEVKKDKTEDEEEEEPTPGLIKYNKLGHDENIHQATLEDANDSRQQDHLVRPTSGLMESAYDAIAKMDSLQHELLTTEIRAQDAEKKAIELQEQLNSANEKIRALEKAVNALQDKRESDVATPQDKTAEERLPSAKPSAERIETPESKPQSPADADSSKRKGTKTAAKTKKQAAGKKK